MRVALDGMLVNQCVSGVETAIYALAGALAEHGTASYRFYLPRACPQPVIEAGERFRTRRAPVRATNRLFRILWEQFAMPLRLRADGVDLLHAPGYLAPWMTRKPVVLTVYDLIALDHPRLCRRLNAWNYRLTLPHSIRRANGIIVPSQATARSLAQRFPKAAAKTTVIPLGVAPSFTPCEAAGDLARLRRAYGLPAHFLLFVGQLEPKKNLPMLLEAFALLQRETGCPHKLVLAGRRGWGCEPIDDTIEAFGLHDDVLILGAVPRHDLAGLYSLAGLFLFPSLVEGFGLPPLEAMACGTPVVVSSGGSLPEVVGSAATVVDPADIPGWVEAIEVLLMNQTLRAARIAAGRQQAAAFTWERTARETEAFYRTILGPEDGDQDG